MAKNTARSAAFLASIQLDNPLLTSYDVAMEATTVAKRAPSLFSSSSTHSLLFPPSIKGPFRFAIWMVAHLLTAPKGQDYLSTSRRVDTKGKGDVSAENPFKKLFAVHGSVHRCGQMTWTMRDISVETENGGGSNIDDQPYTQCT